MREVGAGEHCFYWYQCLFHVAHVANFYQDKEVEGRARGVREGA
jgi:hypothetical protein